MPATLDAIGRSDVMGRDGFTWWVGEVEDIEDPQNLGRTKVRIIGWYTGAGEVAYTKEMPTQMLHHQTSHIYYKTHHQELPN